MNFDLIHAAFGKLNQSQVDGINFLENASAGLPDMHRAYVMATAWHESARFEHMHEIGPRHYFDKYEPGTHLGRMLGNTIAGDGFRFRGRGLCQLTGRRNYSKAGTAVGLDLLADPDKAADLAVAVKIIVAGMVQGWFTGLKLSDFKTFSQMRRIINGMDRAMLIAGYAETFQKALGAP